LQDSEVGYVMEIIADVWLLSDTFETHWNVLDFCWSVL